MVTTTMGTTLLLKTIMCIFSSNGYYITTKNTHGYSITTKNNQITK